MRPSDEHVLVWALTLDAIGRNLDEGTIRLVSSQSQPLAASFEVCARLQNVPYWFDVDATRRGVLSWSGIQREGRAACMEATALVASVALAAGAPYVELCLERHSSSPSYRHLRPIVEGIAVDCYQEKSLDVPSCSEVWRVDRNLVTGLGRELSMRNRSTR